MFYWLPFSLILGFFLAVVLGVCHLAILFATFVSVKRLTAKSEIIMCSRSILTLSSILSCRCCSSLVGRGPLQLVVRAELNG